MKTNNTARSITAAAIVGAAYAALTMLLAPISYGAIQVRVSEALVKECEKIVDSLYVGAVKTPGLKSAPEPRWKRNGA